MKTSKVILDLIVITIIPLFVGFLILLILPPTKFHEIFGIDFNEVILYSSIYLISIVPSSIYFFRTDRKWWYGLLSPVIGGMTIAVISFLIATLYFQINGGPGF